MKKLTTMRPHFGLFVLGLLAIPACYGSGTDGGEEFENIGAESQAMSTICADPSNATIVGTAGDDYLLVTSGDDIIFGLDGDDIIVGKGGNDILCGGLGADSIQGGSGEDQIDGGAGYNTLQGNEGDDTIYGGDDGNEIQGGDGDDTLEGGAGVDTLYGGSGDDLMRAGAGDDDVIGMDGDDRLFGDAGEDWLVGGEGNDCLDGGADDDRVNGQGGDDCVSGGDGVDQVTCGAGNDTYSEGEYDYAGCETAGTCNCEPECNNLKESFADNAAGWTLDAEWQIGAAVPSSGGNGFCANSNDPAFDHTDTADNGLAGVAIGGNASINGTHGFYWLTSPAIDTAAEPDLFLEYWRWLVSDYTPYMANQVQVWDGNAWQTVFQTGSNPGIQDTSWMQQQFDISAYSNAALQVRFGFDIGVSPGVWNCPSWSVDDVRIYSSDCQE